MDRDLPWSSIFFQDRASLLQIVFYYVSFIVCFRSESFLFLSSLLSFSCLGTCQNFPGYSRALIFYSIVFLVVYLCSLLTPAPLRNTFHPFPLVIKEGIQVGHYPMPDIGLEGFSPHRSFDRYYSKFFISGHLWPLFILSGNSAVLH